MLPTGVAAVGRPTGSPPPPAATTIGHRSGERVGRRSDGLYIGVVRRRGRLAARGGTTRPPYRPARLHCPPGSAEAMQPGSAGEGAAAGPGSGSAGAVTRGFRLKRGLGR